MSYTTTSERIKEERKANRMAMAPSYHPKFLVERCIFENIQLTIEEVDYYIGAKEIMGEEVDRLWLLKKLAEGYVLDAPYHLIKKILKILK